MGFLGPPVYMLLMTGVYWGPVLSLVATMSGVLGGAVGYGLVVAAKRAPSELAPGDEAPMLDSVGTYGPYGSTTVSPKMAARMPISRTVMTARRR